MSITPERLDELAQQLALENFTIDEIKHIRETSVSKFASALLAAVEAELVSVAWNYELHDGAFQRMCRHGFDKDTALVSLPLIKEES